MLDKSGKNGKNICSVLCGLRRYCGENYES
jgi:hypothetical protein